MIALQYFCCQNWLDTLRLWSLPHGSFQWCLASVRGHLFPALLKPKVTTKNQNEGPLSVPVVLMVVVVVLQAL
jgi:hypothetical protein